MRVDNDQFFADATPQLEATVGELRGEVARLKQQLLEERAVRERHLDMLRQDIAKLRQNVKTTLRVAMVARGSEGWGGELDLALRPPRGYDPLPNLDNYPEVDF